MRILALSRIVWEDTDGLQPIGARVAGMKGRHERHQSARIMRPVYCPQGLIDFATSKRGKSFGHYFNTLVHGQKLFDVTRREYKDLIRHMSSLMVRNLLV